jgi:hypothetical protein
MIEKVLGFHCTRKLLRLLFIYSDLPILVFDLRSG